MRARRRPVAVVASVASVLLFLAACANVVDGSGTNSVVPTSAGPQTPTGGGSTGPTDSTGPTSVSTPPTTPVTTPPPTSVTLTTSAQLIPLLQRAPAGSQPWGNSWGNNVTPTLAQFVNQVYAPSAVSFVTKQLIGERITGIAHRTWIAKTGTQADVILLRFADVNGALHRLNFIATAKTYAGGNKKFIVAKPAHLQTYYATKVDSDGYVRSITYTSVGPVVIEVFGFSKKKLAKDEIIKWGVTQAQLLQ